MSGVDPKAVAADRFIGDVTDWVQELVRMNALVASGLELTPTDLHCLHLLQQDGPTTTGRLGERVGLSAGAASRMVDRLEDAGFATRSRDAADRRKVSVAATAAGLRRAGAAYAGLTGRTLRDLAHFSAEDLEIINRFVSLSLQSVRAEADDLAAGGTSA